MRKVRKKIKLFLEKFRKYSVETLCNGKVVSIQLKSEPLLLRKLEPLNNSLKFNAIKNILSPTTNISCVKFLGKGFCKMWMEHEKSIQLLQLKVIHFKAIRKLLC